MNVTTKRHAALFSTYVRPEWRRVAWLSIVLFAGIGLELYKPQIVRGFLDAAKEGAALRLLLNAGALYLGIGLVHQIVSTVGSYVTQDVGWRTTNRLRSDLARHCLSLDMSFQKDRTPGEMIERVDGDVTAIANFFSVFIQRVFGSAILLIGIAVLIGREDWRLGLALGGLTGVTMFIVIRCREFAVPAFASEREGEAQLYGFVEERLAGIEDIRTNGGVRYAMNRLYGKSAELFKAVKRAGIHGAVLYETTRLLSGIMHVVALSGGYLLYRGGDFTIGTVFLVFHYTSMLSHPIHMIGRQIQDMQRAAAGIKRVDELMAMRSSIPDGALELPRGGGAAVEFENVEFGYVEDEPVIRDLSFKIATGETLGLLGRTGSGKTTITRLLFRFYDVDLGRVLLDGRDIRDAQRDEVRRRVALVTQNVQLFNASVRDNLTLFQDDILDARIESVLRELELGAWFDSLSDGLDTPLNSGEAGLSAGQAQLLAFSRVFLRDPGLVILDEPSSKLDPATERQIDRAVERLLRGRTGIIIAHRLDTVQKVDSIMILEDGRLREHGKRRELANDPNSRFSQLLTVGIEGELA